MAEEDPSLRNTNKNRQTIPSPTYTGDTQTCNIKHIVNILFGICCLIATVWVTIACTIIGVKFQKMSDVYPSQLQTDCPTLANYAILPGKQKDFDTTALLWLNISNLSALMVLMLLYVVLSKCNAEYKGSIMSWFIRIFGALLLGFWLITSFIIVATVAFCVAYLFYPPQIEKHCMKSSLLYKTVKDIELWFYPSIIFHGVISSAFVLYKWCCQ
eukprot:238202_1